MEKVANDATEDVAEPGKLVSFVVGVGAELTAQQCRLALPTTELRSLGLFPPAGKASKGRCRPSASQIYSKCSNYRGLPPAAALTGWATENQMIRNKDAGASPYPKPR